MAIQMMKGYGLPSARTVDFSGFGGSGFGDFAMGEFLGGHSPEQFMKIPPLDGYGYESYSASAEDPYIEERAIQACTASGGRWNSDTGACQPGLGIPYVPPPPQPPAPSNTIGKVLGWGAAIYFAARWLK